MRHLILLTFTLFLMASAALAAEITVSGSETCQTQLSGQIIKGDADKLRVWFQNKGLFEGNIHSEALCLESPGGSLSEALKMGQFLYNYGIRTRLEENSSCLSACSVLFMMGTEYLDHGSGDGSNADRRMHITAKLGFHRPELRLPAGGTVKTEQLGRAYDLAIVSVLEFVKVANYGSHRETMIPSDLIEVMMERRGEDYFFIDTVGKAGRWNIGLMGVEMPHSMDKTAALTACNNLAIWQLRYEDNYSNYGGFDLDLQVEAVTEADQGITYAVFGGFGAIDNHHECLIRLRDFGDGHQELDVCGFMDAENVTIGPRRCEAIVPADPTVEVWDSPLSPMADDARMALLPPGTRLVDAETVSRKIDARVRQSVGTQEEVGLQAFRSRCSEMTMTAQVRGVKNFTNLRSAAGFEGEVIGEVALGERVSPVQSTKAGFHVASNGTENCRSACEWMTPGPGGIKALYSAGPDFDFINQCFEGNNIWYQVKTTSGLQGYVSGKFLRY